MSDWKTVLGLLLLAILLLAFVQYVYGPVSAADNLTVNNTTTAPTPTPTPSLVQMVNTSTPTSTPIRTPVPKRVITTAPTSKIVPVMINTSSVPDTTVIPYYVQQGDVVYLNSTVDISGVMAGVLNLAYYGGYDEESGEQFLLELPERKSGYYKFYIDPEIFSSRMGKWYKWNGYVERQANNLVFVVANTRLAPNLTGDIELQNPNQTPVILPKTPLLPDKHIADYLIARGNSLTIPTKGATIAWVFGNKDSIYDYRAINRSLDLTEDVINRLSPGSYKLLLQTRGAGSTGDFNIQYNTETYMIDWFDPATFTVEHFNTYGQTPDNVLNKLLSLLPLSSDTYTLHTLEVEMPTISINQVDSLMQLNSTAQNQGVSLEAPGYIDVRGYTNAAPDTVIRVTVDPELNLPVDRMFRDAIATSSEGDVPGDLRTFKAIVPVQLYNMAPGKHIVAAKSELSDAYATADFYIYDSPTGTYSPNKTIRYISGRYGPEELVPTPTPIIVTQIVTRVVTQIVTVPVTPSNEQVYAQQKIASEKTWWEGAWWLAKGITGSLFLIGGMWYGVSVFRRLKE